MKTTLEMPDFLFRRAKSIAAERGISLRQLVTEALQDKLNLTGRSRSHPWMKHMGKLKHLRRETERIDRRIEESFEQVDREDWK